jgi:hypothetical protein
MKTAYKTPSYMPIKPVDRRSSRAADQRESSGDEMAPGVQNSIIILSYRDDHHLTADVPIETLLSVTNSDATEVTQFFLVFNQK